MSGYYPLGSMTGSGIDDYDTEGTVDCAECGAFVSTTITWRGLQYTFTCPECGADVEGSL